MGGGALLLGDLLRLHLASRGAAIYWPDDPIGCNAGGYGNGAPMARIVEKPDGTIVLLVHLSLKPGRDDAIIQLLRSAPKRGLAGIVREAMRTGIGQAQFQHSEAAEETFELPDLGIDL